eukprot:3603767-Rhodomonas_salina.3
MERGMMDRWMGREQSEDWAMGQKWGKQQRRRERALLEKRKYLSCVLLHGSTRTKAAPCSESKLEQPYSQTTFKVSESLSVKIGPATEKGLEQGTRSWEAGEDAHGCKTFVMGRHWDLPKPDLRPL